MIKTNQSEVSMGGIKNKLNKLSNKLIKGSLSLKKGGDALRHFEQEHLWLARGVTILSPVGRLRDRLIKLIH